jgi:acetyl esterase/lipase
MNHQDLAKYKKEMRGYAETYSMLFRASTKDGFMKMNAISDLTLKGKWTSLHTTAITVYLKRPDGTSMRVLVVTKKNHTAVNCTGLLWLHGGGYAVGLPEQDVPFANLFLAEDNCVMVLPDYTRSVDAPYPAALNDAYQTLVWMKKNAGSLGIRQDQIFVGGESAGGGLACALTLYARDKGEVNIAFQMPLYPMLDDRMTETSSHNASPLWDTKKNLAAWQLYRGEKRVTSPYFAPARETNYKNLPPAFTIISDNEPFYAETKTYFDHLYHAGTEILLKEYPGCFHSFDINCPNTEASRNARKLETKVFRYAQKNYFAKQPVVKEKIPATEPVEVEIQNVIRDIEKQQEFLSSQKDVSLSEAPEEEPSAGEVNMPEETEEVLPETEPVCAEENAPEETLEEESVPVEEKIPVVEPVAAEENISEETKEEEAAISDDGTAEAGSVTEEENTAEVLPEVEPVAAEENTLEESGEAGPVLKEESPVEELPPEDTGPAGTEETLPKEVEERPVSESTTVDFPIHPSEKETTISEDEIEKISSELTSIAEEVPPEFEQTRRMEEEEAEAEKETEAVAEEATEPLTKPFTREDVMRLLHQKDEKRQSDDLKPYNNEKEEVYDNLQKILEEDTTTSIEQINDLVDKL